MAEKLAHSREEEIDKAVEFLIRINYEAWLPEDVNIVEQLLNIDQSENSLEPRCMLMDRDLLQQLLKCTYCLGTCWTDNGSSPSTTLDLLWTLGLELPQNFQHESKRYVYSNNDLGRWLFNCEQYLLTSMVAIQQGGEWGSKTFEITPKLWTLVNLLDNVASYIHLHTTWVSKNEPIDIEETISRLLQNHQIAGARPEIGLGNDIDHSCVSWCLRGIKILAGLQDTTIQNIEEHCKSSEISSSYKYMKKSDPQCSQLFSDVARSSDWPENVTVEDFDARYIDTGSFKLIATRYIDEHLTFDDVHNHFRVFFDNRMLPGSTFIVFKGNCMAKYQSEVYHDSDVQVFWP
jgi:hypothetical protein